MGMAQAMVPLLTLTWTAESDQEFALFGYAVASAGDVNADGFDDVIVGAHWYADSGLDEGKASLFLGSSLGLDVAPNWAVDGDQDFASYGFAVGSAGDVDGDGFDDVIVGAPNLDNGEQDEGQVSVYLGTVLGLDTSAAWTAQADQASARFGHAVASAGDVDADGYADVIVGARTWDGGEEDEGRALVFLGSIAGLEASAAWTAEGDEASAWLGHAVRGAGDVNGDGFDDVIVGVPQELLPYEGGRASVFLGSASGLSATAAWTVESAHVGALLGYAVASAGDVNGDGFDDVIVGAPEDTEGVSEEGLALVYLGSATGPSTIEDWSADLEQIGAGFGESVASAGDVNGDGFDDVVVGAYEYDDGETDEGVAFLWLGSASGLGTAIAWSGGSDQPGAQLGDSVAGAGDVDGDGYDDVVVGAPYYDGGYDFEGQALLYIGGCPTDDDADGDGDGVGDQCDDCAGDDATGDADGDGFCASEDCDDANGDSYPGAQEQCDGFDNDCADNLGAEEDDLDLDGVRVCDDDCDDADPTTYPGAAELCDGLDNVCDGTVPQNERDLDNDGSFPCNGDCNNADPAVSAALPEACGDLVDNNCDTRVDEDCRSDVVDGGCGGCAAAGSRGIVGAMWIATCLAALSRRRSRVAIALLVTACDPPGDAAHEPLVPDAAPLVELWTAESNQELALFGIAVASAGDVNGDGTVDVIVGAPGLDNGEEGEGGAFVYAGTVSGPEPMPSWTAESDEPGAGFGRDVSTAGDVNGDGYDDVVVLAYGARRVSVFLGSAAGLEPTAAWSAVADHESSVLYSASGAGDVNGDGFGDLVVGDPGYDEDGGRQTQGRALAYFGSDAGLDETPSWSAETDDAYASFGVSVASAGDVNGDGLDDVLVGADHGLTWDEKGQALMYLGSSLGPSHTADWTAESDEPGAAFGGDVSSAGDVNADGYDDAVVGAPVEGADAQGGAYLYLGSATGLEPAVAWSATSSQISAQFGHSVSAAGDVDGDAYGDVVIGAPDPHEDVGRAVVYLGTPSGLEATPSWQAESDQDRAQFGWYSLAPTLTKTERQRRVERTCMAWVLSRTTADDCDRTGAEKPSQLEGHTSSNDVAANDPLRTDRATLARVNAAFGWA